jgi:large subunit ribosomal protein L4
MTASVNLLDSKFQSKGNLNLNIDLSADSIKVPAVHQVVKALLANRRQGNASTKNKALVSGGGKKPFKQKGTGRARQGSNRSPLMPGGGIAHGPQPRDYTQKINKKLMNAAVNAVIADKHQAGKLFVVDSLPAHSKTKDVFKLLSDRKLFPALIVSADDANVILKSARNLQHAKVLPASGFSVYEALKYENLIIEKKALETLIERMV